MAINDSMICVWSTKLSLSRSISDMNSYLYLQISTEVTIRQLKVGLGFKSGRVFYFKSNATVPFAHFQVHCYCNFCRLEKTISQNIVYKLLYWAHIQYRLQKHATIFYIYTQLLNYISSMLFDWLFKVKLGL